MQLPRGVSFVLDWFPEDVGDVLVEGHKKSVQIREIYTGILTLCRHMLQIEKHSLLFSFSDISSLILHLLNLQIRQNPFVLLWSILLIKSDLKWCIHLSRSLVFYISSTW